MTSSTIFSNIMCYSKLYWGGLRKVIRKEQIPYYMRKEDEKLFSAEDIPAKAKF